MPFKRIRYILLSILSLLLMHACSNGNSKDANAENKITVPKNDILFHQDLSITMKEYLESLKVDSKDSLKQFTGWQEMVKAVYAVRGDSAIWVNRTGFTTKGLQLQQLIDSTEFLGLNKELYPIATIHLYRDSMMKLQPKINYQLAQQMEVLLTKTLLEIMLHLHKGIYTDSIHGIRTNFWNTKESFVSLINNFENKNIRSVFNTLEPQHILYKRYIQALQHFLTLNDITPSKLSIRDYKLDSVGAAEDVKTALIHHRFLADSLRNDATAYIDALKAFQKNNQLVSDGKLGVNTVRALSQDNYHKFQLLVLNADRWRTENTLQQLPSKFIWVNLPSMRMRIIENDSLRMEKRVVIGKANKKNQSPTLEAFVQQIVLWPTWTVPQSIVQHEMKSFVGYDVTYINGMKKVVQPPGPKNALGVVKIDFPNKYAVYMHDTPTKSLFNSDNRAASHGCVRCQDALEVAHYLMVTDTFSITYDSLLALKDDTIKTRIFRLKKQVPVYFRYFTAEPDFDGNMHFFNDVYRKDNNRLNVIFDRKRYPINFSL